MMTLSPQDILHARTLFRPKRALRVAYFAGTMRPGHDGVTRVLYQLIGHLNKRGVENIFFSPIVSQEEFHTVMHRVPSVSFPLYKDYRLALPGHKHFEEQLRAFKPDLLHINSPCSLGYAAMKYGQKNDIPVVATYHTHFASYARYYSARAFEALSWSYFRKVYNGCQRVFVPSRPILHELRERGIRNMEFMPHGVDTDAFNPRFRNPAWKSRLGLEGKIVLLFAGRLVWEKDLRTLAEAYSLLSAQRNDLAFVLAGDGPVREELRATMPGALFLGQLSGVELSTVYASSDIFVFPSTTETFGNVTIEAMASGLPPVCARAGGSEGLVLDGVTGMLTEPRNGADLAAKIQLLAGLPSLRRTLAANAFAFAQQQAWGEIFDRQLESYDRIIDEAALVRLVKNRKAA
jgi:glycosyltransferase involved in cell wall biosynthesis